MNKILTGVVIGAVLGAGGYWALSHDIVKMPDFSSSARPQNAITKDAPVGNFCAKVTTPARDPKTGAIKEFPTSCSVPEGWETITNDVPTLDDALPQ